MKYLGILFCFIIICSHNSLCAQPGMYSESDIEYQTIFFEAHEAKIKGDSDKQIELLKSLIKRDKDCHAAYWELARTYTMLGDQEAAQKNAVKAHELKTSNEWYLLTLAEIYEKTEQYTAAIATYKKLKVINPDNPTIYHKLAQLLLYEKNVEEAVANLQEVQNRHGVDEESSRRIFDIYKANGNKKGAVKAVRTLCDAFPDNTRYLNNLASYYSEIGDNDKALSVYKEIAAIDPYDPKAAIVLAKGNTKAAKGSGKLTSLMPLMENMSIPLDNKIKELMPYVSTMSAEGETTESLDKLCVRLAELYPDDAKVYSLRGDVEFYQAKFEAAELSYKKALDLDDRKYALWAQYFQTLWELEKYTVLENLSYDAIDLYPNKVSAFLFNALALTKNKKSGAKDLVTEASFIAGKNKVLKNQVALVEFWLDKDQVKKDELKAIDLNGIDTPLYYELAGDLYAIAKDNGTANKMWEQAIKLGANAKRINLKSSIE